MMNLYLYFLSFFILFFGAEVLAKKDHPFPLNKVLIRKMKQQGAGLVSDRVGTYILRAEDLATGKEYDQAIQLLEYHYKSKSLTQLAKAHFAMQLGRLYRQSKDNKKSLFYLRQAVDLKILPYHENLSVLYLIAQIYIEDGKCQKALELLTFWFSVNENPPPSSYILLAHCYYVEAQLNKALKYAELSLSLVDYPMESWLNFASAIHLKKKNYTKALPYLEQLTALYPSKATHWKQLAGVYLYLGKIRHAFVTLDLADRMGHLKRKIDYLNLSSLYIDQGLPYQGAELLKSKMKQKIIIQEQKHLKILAEAYWLARERKKSLAYLKKARKKATQPMFFIQYGQKLLDEELWDEAEKTFKKSLNTQEIKKTIQSIQEYKKKISMIYQKENDLKQHYFFQSHLKKQYLTSSKELSAASDKSDKKELRQINQKEVALLKKPPTRHLESIYLGIGISLYQKEKYKEALSYFKKSIEVDDTFLSAYQWIDYTEIKMHKNEKKII